MKQHFFSSTAKKLVLTTWHHVVLRANDCVILRWIHIEKTSSKTIHDVRIVFGDSRLNSTAFENSYDGILLRDWYFQSISFSLSRCKMCFQRSYNVMSSFRRLDLYSSINLPSFQAFAKQIHFMNDCSRRPHQLDFK